MWKHKWLLVLFNLVLLLLAEVCHCVVEQRLAFVASNIGEHALFPALSVTHLTEDLTIAGDDTLDGIIGAIRVVRRLHGRFARHRIRIAECHLSVLEELLSQLLTYHKLTLAVADCNTMCITYLHSTEPWAGGGSHGSRYHLRDVAVDIVAEESWRVWSDHAQLAIRQQTTLHQCLEAVADTQD